MWPHIGFFKLEITSIFIHYRDLSVMMSWIISASIHSDEKVWIWCFNLIPEAFLLCWVCMLPPMWKVKGSGSRESVSDLHAYVTVSHQRGPLCVMLFSQFPLILCSCHPNLMTMFNLPSCQLWLLLYSYAMRSNLCRPTTKWITIRLKLWDMHLYAWLRNMFLEGYFSGGLLDRMWGWVNYMCNVGEAPGNRYCL